MIRQSARLLLPRGRFSSMLDMGGVAEAKTSKRVDLGKNNKIKAVALDFDLITRSLEAQKAKAANEISPVASRKIGSETTIQNSATIEPDVGVAEKLANILNVPLGGSIGQRKDMEDEDLSRLTGESPSRKSKLIGSDPDFKPEEDEIGSSILNVLKKKESKEKRGLISTKAPPLSDVRSKYADKLRKKLDGGLAGVDLAKSEREDALRKGDAPGHLAARKIASAQPVSSGSKWLATTGTGNLLMFLNSRSVRIALLPTPKTSDKETREAEGKRMDDLSKQLPHVNFNFLAKDGHLSSEDILSDVADKIGIDAPPINTLVVSDRDDYLRSAKDRGMFTCRIRPKNAPRGNITTTHTVEDVASVEDVVNELNGISFNTVFSSAGINHGGV